MWGMGDNDDDERFWNLMFFKIYATDKEIEEIAPWIVGGVVLVILIFLVIRFFV